MRTNLALLSVPLLALPLLGSACTSVDSDNVFTSALYARINATADGDGTTTLRTTLFIESPGSLDYIELEGDDLLMAYGPAAVSQQMRESQFLGMTSYSATFDTEAENSEFIVEFTRTIDDSAPDSRVTLPPPFDILTADGESYSRATDDIIIDWDLIGTDAMDYRLEGGCVEAILGTIAVDEGTLTIPSSEVVKRPEEDVEDTCLVTVQITRSRPGTIDPNYGYGGDAFAHQSRTFRFTSTP